MTLLSSGRCAMGDRFVEELHLPAEVLSFAAEQPGQGPEGSSPPLATESGGRLARAAPLPPEDAAFL